MFHRLFLPCVDVAVWRTTEFVLLTFASFLCCNFPGAENETVDPSENYRHPDKSG